MRTPWFALVEVCPSAKPCNAKIKLTLIECQAWAVAKLVRSPVFNRAVQKLHRKINRLPPTEPENGGGRTGASALDHFKDEIKHQFRELTWQKRPPKQ